MFLDKISIKNILPRAQCLKFVKQTYERFAKFYVFIKFTAISQKETNESEKSRFKFHFSR
ncbi:hypothetical protein CAMRE0001_0615 [Campylobacter rectus RM3267]|uniref:Uncharacterized protein n=1 Tax=Campylobacter rectus RM3267 TaxID=553218 RepID=B9D1F6_CAMRE|nr:hypothetical protein CAMRE0001_0615 [Campylobacter rectus RM3267]